MTIQELRVLIRQLKPAIKYANDTGQFMRVQWLKAKKKQLKAKLHAAIHTKDVNIRKSHKPG